MRKNGRKTAEIMYEAEGFCAHHNTDIWGDTAPQGNHLPSSYWPLGAAWLCTHLWEHYAFSRDEEFLEEEESLESSPQRDEKYSKVKMSTS